MYVSVVFVIRCLYSAVSLTLIREQRFIRSIIIIINYVQQRGEQRWQWKPISVQTTADRRKNEERNSHSRTALSYSGRELELELENFTRIVV